MIERINSSDDIKKLNYDELVTLCAELREFLIQNVSKTGGHLASNLGVVELTVALHRVYDTSVDRIVFDVGHQSYVHKIITGRRDKFSTLRQHGGLSGFPKPYESDDDAFIAGHASNSVSVAAGMARARKFTGDKYDVAAVIGDGALTGGLAYEGLEDAASSGEPMVIILNDNNMSISKNVGGMSHMLADLRYRSAYLSFKQTYRTVMKKMPGLYNFNHKLKECLKRYLLRGNTFSQMGFEYIGPVDGHDVRALEQAIRLAKDMEEPVIVHVLTRKGKGCFYAERHPDKYHGVGPFDPTTGEIKDSKLGFADYLGQYMCGFAARDKRICTVTAAMCGGTGLTEFEKQFPDRFVDVGIAEGHAAAMTAGMAKQGALPVFAVYSSFLQRAYDMLIHDVSLQNLHVVFCVDRAGLVGSDGETHHGLFDVNYLSSVPGMSIMCPASFQELHDMLAEAIFNTTGPVAVRYPRGGEGAYRDSRLEAESILRTGRDVTIVTYGTMINQALAAADMLEKEHIEAEVIKLGMIKPNNFELTMASLMKTSSLLVAEEVCAAGCVGQRILALCAENEVELDSVKLANLGDGIIPQGTVAELLHDNGLDAAGLAESVKNMIKTKHVVLQ
ncbi:MAG: 1-deoxy-D-xylulose-5-phosphate synthase [Oscillospiraceae bacterium]|nr:1-deoxy-D-xylulose-5-phosphate synthase [Oscillospiraceae bacterium]